MLSHMEKFLLKCTELNICKMTNFVARMGVGRGYRRGRIDLRSAEAARYATILGDSEVLVTNMRESKRSGY